MRRRAFDPLIGAAVVTVLLLGACRQPARPRPQRSIVLVTIDTLRADHVSPRLMPALDALGHQAVFFEQAITVAPLTLPAHASLLTGLYPPRHRVRDNQMFALPGDVPTYASLLKRHGYATGAFVSAVVLSHRYGLNRGFDVYDDDMPDGGAERSSRATTDLVLAELQRPAAGPRFLWVHYYDPHAPYTPPEPFASRYRSAPYLGEIAAMDEQLGRLVEAFERGAGGPSAIIIAADHGEGLGDHGEPQHGNLLYQSTVHVPLLLVGPGVAPGTSDTPVSTRHVFHTILDWAGLGATDSLRADRKEIVLGEAMKPFLDYGWQPQTMAIDGPQKVIHAGTTDEVYDVRADPGETRDLATSAALSRPLRDALRDYPVPSLQAARVPDAVGEEEKRKLASLGYVGAGTAPVVRAEAPRPASMTALFDPLERASFLFVSERYADAVPLLQKILIADPHNLDAVLRLATAHGALGRAAQADQLFERAAMLAPGSADVRMYRALHDARTPNWPRAVPQLEQVIAESPERVPALEALATLRERQGRPAEAAALWRRVYALRPASAAELARLGEIEMAAAHTEAALEAFEKARALQGPRFTHDLELGVLYLDAQRLQEARSALDRVPPSHPAYAMVLFKRAQVAVLLHEADAAQRIGAARRQAYATTRPLIARERLFAR